MLTIIHGNDTQKSRNYLFGIKQNNKNVITLDGKTITETDLLQNLEGDLLFGSDKTIIIEDLFGNKKTNTTDFKKIAKILLDRIDSTTIYLWESKEITKTALSSLKKADVIPFSLPQSLFLFLDSLSPQNTKTLIELFHKTIISTEPEMVFFMMVRQFRILLALKEPASDSIDEVKRIAPWQLGKLTRQSKLFSTESLKENYKKLFSIERALKTGGLTGSLPQTIDFFLLSL